MQKFAIQLSVWAVGLAWIWSISVQPASAAEGYTYPLFDGKTLDGWTVENDCEVEVQDGMLLLKSGNGWLRSHQTYGDFRLHVEWKALQKENYDAGIYLRTGREGKPFPKRGYQANLLQGREGNVGNLPGAVSTGLVNPPGQWNTFDITVVGDRVRMVINDQPAYEVGGIEETRGHIGIQVEVPKGGQFLVRNLIVTELGYRSLFNGMDLTGWEGAGQPAEKCWEVVDSLLQCTGQKGPWLRSAQPFDDFNLRLDYQVASGGNSGVYVRVPANGAHHRKNEDEPPAGFEVQILDDGAAKYRKLKNYQYTGAVYDIVGPKFHVAQPAGQWNSLEINCKGHQVTTLHNGVVIVDASPEQFPLLMLRNLKGYLGLQNHSSIVKYRNIRIGPAAEDLPKENGFVPLFNGRDLSGWEGNFDLWTVQDGMIVGNSPGISHNDFLATRNAYGDFELRLEFRLHNGVGNSGIQFRSERVPDSTAVVGYQADIGQNFWGCLYDEHRRNKVLVQAPPELKDVLKEDDWNQYVIRAVGNHVVLKINGLTTVDYREPDETIARRGIIALQVHSGGPQRIDFRNIRIQELADD